MPGYLDSGNLEQIMAGRRKKKDYPQNAFNTWLDYCNSIGLSKADLIRKVTDGSGKRHDNSKFTQYQIQLIGTPGYVLRDYVKPDSAAMVQWLLEERGMELSTEAAEVIAEIVNPDPDLVKVLSYILDAEGVVAKPKVVKELASKFTAPVKIVK